MTAPLFNIVLLNPEIPNNTGTIGRTAAATGCRLHVVHPIGFSMDEKARRRAGLDYWTHLDVVEHEDWEAFLRTCDPPRLWLYTSGGSTAPWDAPMQRGDWLLFGRESAGVPESVEQWIDARWGPEHRVTLPMIDHPRMRSLNLSNAVTAAIYEGMRQTGGQPGPLFGASSSD
ncbi:MAG: tRNA (cytidine(34)-2'-O)-methyltransferase [Phycisphaerales bacterium]